MNRYNLTKLLEYNKWVKKYLPGGVHYNFRLPWEEIPIHFVKGEGSRLWDMDGNEYLDLYARFGAMILGHKNKEYNDYLKAMIDTAMSVSHCTIDAQVLELIAQFVPSAEMIRFGLSGTEIVQNALRLARAYTKKNRIIRFEGHYHGNADNIMGGKAMDKLFPVPIDYTGDLKGTEGRALNCMENQTFLIPWNDVPVLEYILEQYADEVAAVITEPVCVNGGGIMPKPGYLKKLRALCDKYNVVLIFDEIITGFRMGLSGAQGYFGVTPDLTTLGKAIAGGGLPVSALAGKKEIMQLLVDKKVVHAGTFNGYPLGTAAIKINLEILSEQGGVRFEQMNACMSRMHSILIAEGAKQGIPLVIQGPAACASYHCSDKVLDSTSEYSYDMMFKDILINNALSMFGVLVSTFSRMYPNIALTEEDVAFFKEKAALGLKEAKGVFDEIYSIPGIQP